MGGSNNFSFKPKLSPPAWPTAGIWPQKPLIHGQVDSSYSSGILHLKDSRER